MKTKLLAIILCVILACGLLSKFTTPPISIVFGLISCLSLVFTIAEVWRKDEMKKPYVRVIQNEEWVKDTGNEFGEPYVLITQEEHKKGKYPNVEIVKTANSNFSSDIIPKINEDGGIIFRCAPDASLPPIKPFVVSIRA